MDKLDVCLFGVWDGVVVRGTEGDEFDDRIVVEVVFGGAREDLGEHIHDEIHISAGAEDGECFGCVIFIIEGPRGLTFLDLHFSWFFLVVACDIATFLDVG